jgi:PAS domain-containing protein
MVTGTIKQNNFEIGAHIKTVQQSGLCLLGKVHSSRFMQGYYVSYIQDITKRKQAEITIRKSAELYCALTENMKDVILILDPELMKATYISPSVYKMLGYKPEEILSLPLDKLLGDVNSDKLLIDIRKIIADAQTAKEKNRNLPFTDL